MRNNRNKAAPQAIVPMLRKLTASEPANGERPDNSTRASGKLRWRRRSKSLLANSFLLLGAGASVKAGVPSANEFVGAISDYLKTLPGQVAGPLLRELESVCSVLKTSAQKEVGLEPLFEAIDDCLEAHFLKELSPPDQRNVPPSIGLMPSRATERLHYEIKRVIQRSCDIRDSTKVSYLLPLLNSLRAHAPFRVVSFNYDNAIEIACIRNGMRFTEPIVDGSAKDQEIELIKVHGSVTWFADKAGGIRRLVRYSDSVLRKSGELRSAVLETPLIYPSRRKMPVHGPFMQNALHLQRLFSDRERTACIVIGYSFPDMHMRNWLREAMAARPDLMLYLVDPYPDRALQNLVYNLPTIAWTERLRIVSEKLEDILRSDEDFERNLLKARKFGPDFRTAFDERPLWSGTKVHCFNGKVSSLAAAPDGGAIYISKGGHEGRVLKVKLSAAELACGEPQVFARGLKDPRGLAIADDGRVFAVQNRLLRTQLIPTTGAGTVVEIGADGRRRKLLTRIPIIELLNILRQALKAGTQSADIWERTRSLLRWPTDITCGRDGAIYVTEARALVRIATDGTIIRFAEPELAFNLHGIDTAPDGALAGVELGVAQTFSWGKVRRFEAVSAPVKYTDSRLTDGTARLMGICSIPRISMIAVTKSLSWPLGGIWMLDYPAMESGFLLEGFNFPQKIAYVPNKDLLAISELGKVVLIPVSDLRPPSD